MRDTGTEWLYRLLSQPKRLKRQIVLPKFYCRLCLKELKGLINKGEYIHEQNWHYWSNAN